MSFRVRSSGLSNPPSPPIRRKRNVKALLASANVAAAKKKRTTPQKQPTAKVESGLGFGCKGTQMYVFSLFFLCCDIDQFIFVSQWVANSLSWRKEVPVARNL
jgi:hypothetical protein